MSEGERHLFGMMEIAERHQRQVEQACQALAEERQALVAERAALKSERAAWREDMRLATRSEVGRAMDAVQSDVFKATQLVVHELETSLTHLLHYASQAQHALVQLVSWAQWRVLTRVGLVLMGLAGFAWVLGAGVSAWDNWQITRLTEERDALKHDIAQMQDHYDDFKASGVLQELHRCNPGNRPCIRVDMNAGVFGDAGDVRIIKGY